MYNTRLWQEKFGKFGESMRLPKYNDGMYSDGKACQDNFYDKIFAKICIV